MYKKESINSLILLNNFLRYKWHVLTILLSILLITTLYIKYLTPIYSSSTLIAIDDNKASQMTSLFPKNNTINDVDRATQLNYEISILKSRTIILDILKKVDLSTRFFIRDVWIDRELYEKEIPFKFKFKEEPNTKRDSFKFIIEEIDSEYFNLSNSIKSQKVRYRYGQEIKKRDYQLTIEKREDNTSLVGQQYIITKESNKESLISMVLKNLIIEKKSDKLLDIRYEDPIPKRAKDIATQLILSYKAYNLKERQLQDVNSIEFFDKTIVKIENRLKKIKTRLSSYQSQHKELLMLGSEDKFFFDIIKKNRNITELSLQLNALKETKERIDDGIYSISLLENNELRVSDLQQLMQQLREKSNKLKLLYQQKSNRKSPLIKDVNYKDILIKLDSANRKLKELNIEFTSEYDGVKKTKENIKRLEASLERYLTNHISSHSIEIKELKSKIQRIITSLIISIQKKYSSLQTSLKEDRANINKLPKSSMKFEELKREFNLNENNHNKLLQKRGEALISKASTISNIHIINSATLSDIPIKPQKSFIYLSGIVLAFILSIAYTSFKISREKTIYNRDEVELDNYELIYNRKKINEDNLLTLIAKFEELNQSSKSETILISSDGYYENKSITALKLASTLTNISKKVLIIDFDIYNAKLSHGFNLTSNLGLSTLLTSRHSFDEMDIEKEYIKLIKHDNTTIHLLPTGPILPNGSVILFNQKNRMLLEKLAQEYEYIIIDAPPLGQYPETTVLLKYVDIFLVTAIIQRSHKDFFEKLKEIHNKRLKKIIFLSEPNNKRKVAVV